MNKIYLIIIFAVISANLYSQDLSKVETNNLKGEENSINLEIRGVSAQTAIFMLDSEDSKTRNKLRASNSLKEEYNIISLEDCDYINAFVESKSAKNLEDKYGFLVNSSNNGLHTGLIPIHKLQEMSNDSEVSYIDIGSKYSTRLDQALSSTKATSVHEAIGGIRFPGSGKGVIVGIIDTGFDYTHPSFYNESKTEYRVSRVWEQHTHTGSSPKNFNSGTEYTGAAILAREHDYTFMSHGTHVAGIAAGSGSGSKDLLYKGVAFDSEIVLVSTTMNTISIADAIQYIFEYSKSVGKPCVINISIGGHTGPHDGKSMFDRFCDNMVGNGKVIVGAAGNEGKDKIFLEKTLTETDSILASQLIFRRKPSKGQTYIDIWGNENQEFEVRVATYNKLTQKIEDSTSYVSSKSFTTRTFNLGNASIGFSKISITSDISQLNNKPNILLRIDNLSQTDDYRYATIEVKSKNSEIKMWANSAEFTKNGQNPYYENGKSSHSVGEIGGTGNSMISVGAYTSKNNYIRYSNGRKITISHSTLIGNIAPFSSMGPTADNRTKPDITAPGNVIVSSVNRFDQDYTNNSSTTVDVVNDGSNEWRYSTMEGTSMASPMVTGIIALWLEVNPQLNTKQIIDIFKTTATKDDATGTIPLEGSNTWGWGKINALDGMLAAYKLPGNISESNLFENKAIIFPNPAQSVLNIKSFQTITEVQITNIKGQNIIGLKNLNTDDYAINLEHLDNGIYFIKIKLEDSPIIYKKFVINK